MVSDAASDSDLRFTVIDYGIFGAMLAISAIIGIFFGFCGKNKQNNPLEYLLGSKSLSIIPVAISLTATHISAVSVLGVPAEMYSYGIQYWACAFSSIFVTVITGYLYLPVLHELQITSCFTYLARRYGRDVCSLASVLYTFGTVIMLPLLVYAPAIAFSQVAQINLHYITPIMCVICIFYTTVGGVRAVVWADTLQFGAMISAILAVMYLGTAEVGGVLEVFSAADRGGRLIFFDLNPDPMARSSFWIITVGLTIMWITFVGLTPDTIQRFLSVATLKDSQKICWMFGIGHTLIKLFSVYNGLLIFGKYETCDPVSDGRVEKPDQIFAYYVMDVARQIPGLTGLFVAGVFSAALSSMSSCLNTLAGTLYYDFMKPRYPNTSDLTASKIMKGLVLLIGAITLGLVFFVGKLSNIFSLGITIGGLTSGIYLGMFTLGMFVPRVNKKGILWGSYMSLIGVGIIAFGAQYLMASGQLKHSTLPFRTDGCENSTATYGESSSIHIVNEDHDNSAVFWLFRISFMYYGLIGTVILVLVALPVSYLTSTDEELLKLDVKLISPILRKSFQKHKERLQIATNEAELEELWLSKKAQK